MKLATSLMNFECQPCGIFEVLPYHQEDESIYPNIFAATVGLGGQNKEVSLVKLHGYVDLSFSRI